MPWCCCCCHCALWWVKPSLMIPLWSVMVQGHYSEYPLQETFSIIFRSVEEIYHSVLSDNTYRRTTNNAQFTSRSYCPHLTLLSTWIWWYRSIKTASFSSFCSLITGQFFLILTRGLKLFGENNESYNMNDTLTPPIIFIFNRSFWGRIAY